MKKDNLKKQTANSTNTVLPAVLFVVFGVIAYFAFNYITDGQKHIDGTAIDWWEKWVTAIGIGIIGFCIGKLFTGNDDCNDGTGGDMDGFPFGAF
jgi:TRAP-type C4-dicarboxylate transport system permease small subunit